MTAPANRWKLGLFVVAGGAATLTGLTWIGMRELRRAYHTVYAYFDEALTGLEEGSPVKFRGVTIGIVQEITVAPDKKHLEVAASLYDEKMRRLGLDVERIDEDSPPPENLRAQVVMSWVTSTAFVQVDFFPDPPSGPQQLPFPVKINTMRTVPSTAKSLEDASREVLRELPLMAISARELIDQLRSDVQAAHLPDLARRVQESLRGIDQLLVDLQHLGTVGSATAAMDAVRDAAASLRDENGPLSSALKELQALAASVRTQLDAALLPATAGSVRGAADSLGGLGTDLRAELAKLHTTLAAVERLAQLLERDPGALLYGRGASRPSPLEVDKR
ncbi:MAG TPA: MlaD family protein [Planctomycetota bacterium]|nr:MlaD family protein [Planctomycetota bacterium]